MENLRHILPLTARKILSPLIRIMLKHGVSCKEFEEIVRELYVKIGYDDFTIQGRKQTVSRVAVLTGLSRKEVFRIKMLLESEVEPDKGPLNRAARVISGWISDKEFVDDQGKPKDLPPYGEHASFAQLVKRYSGDITAGAIIDELLRVGAITKLDNDDLHLNTNAYVPRESEAEMLNVVGNCTYDLLQTMEHNLDHDKSEPRFQRSLSYHELPRDVVDEFKQLSQEKSEILLTELNAWLKEKKQSLPVAAEGTPLFRTGLGIYYFEQHQQ